MLDMVTRSNIAAVIADIAKDTQKRKMETEKDSGEFLPKSGETFDSIRDEYISKISSYTQKTLDELSSLENTKEIINPLLYFCEKVSDIALMENECSLKLKNFTKDTTEELLESMRCSVKVLSCFQQCADKIILACEEIMMASPELKHILNTRESLMYIYLKNHLNNGDFVKSQNKLLP